MKTILIVSCVFPPEPVVSANLSYDISHKIQKVGRDVVVLSPRPSRPLNYPFPKIDRQLSVKHVTSDSYICPQSKILGRFMESYSFGRATYNFIKRHHSEISVIYANTWPLFAQYYLAKAAKKYNIPYFIHVQDIYPESYCKKMPSVIGTVLYKLLFPIDKYILKGAIGVFAISPAMKTYLSKSRELDESKVVLVRNWQNDKAYIDAYKQMEKKHDIINIMYLGSINPTANVTLIINAFSRLKGVKYKLSIIGNGPDKENCQELAERLEISATFDTVTPDMVAKKQSEADILVLCLKKGVAQTATPSKLTAYMLSGRPIIASVDLDSDCANIIRESGCGLVVEPDDVEALSNAIEDMASKSTDDLNQLGKNSYVYAKENLSKERNLKILVDTVITH